MANNEFEQRRQTVASGLAEHKLDGLLVSFGPNLRYLSGFTGSNALLLLTPAQVDPVHRSALHHTGRPGIHLPGTDCEGAAGGRHGGGYRETGPEARGLRARDDELRRLPVARSQAAREDLAGGR